MNRARRDLVVQTPFSTMHTTGAFTLRSTVRPNSIVEVMVIDRTTLQVRGLDSLDGRPLIDLKPECGTRSSGRITVKPRRRDQFRGAVEATSTGVAR
jgi:tRNA (Thr-GGU) A37 N-methylase